MPDVFTRNERSQVMARIKSGGNKATERELAAIFCTQHMVRWLQNQKLLSKSGTVFSKRRVCVFVDGCFWRGYPKCYRAPTITLGIGHPRWNAPARGIRTSQRLCDPKVGASCTYGSTSSPKQPEQTSFVVCGGGRCQSNLSVENQTQRR